MTDEQELMELAQEFITATSGGRYSVLSAQRVGGRIHLRIQNTEAFLAGLFPAREPDGKPGQAPRTDFDLRISEAELHNPDWFKPLQA